MGDALQARSKTTPRTRTSNGTGLASNNPTVSPSFATCTIFRNASIPLTLRLTSSPLGERKTMVSPTEMLPRVTRPVATVPRPAIENTSSTSKAKAPEEPPGPTGTGASAAKAWDDEVPGSALRPPKIPPSKDAKNPFGISEPHLGQVADPFVTSL